MCDCPCHDKYDIVYACVNCKCKSEPKPSIPMHYSYNNCGNCTHNILQRIWHYSNHRVKTETKGVDDS